MFEPGWDVGQEKWVFKDVVVVEMDRMQCSMHYGCFNALNEEGKEK